jgi:hypothetical protein
VRAELYRPDASDDVLAVATWEGSRAELQMKDPSIEGLDRILRPTPVVVDDPSLRGPAASGPVLLQPGGLEWFRAALLTRAPSLGLGVRFVAERAAGGWDPAAQYRTFDQQVERLSG